MAAKGTAAKSASGASMSKYDVEVEKRLVALEAAVKEIQDNPIQAHSHDSNDSGDVASEIAELRKKIDSVMD